MFVEGAKITERVETAVVAIIPRGLKRITADETKAAKLETLRTVADVRALDIAHDIRLASARGAGAVAAEFFERKEILRAVVPDNREFIADDFDAGGVESGGFRHKRKLATVTDSRYNINP